MNCDQQESILNVTQAARNDALNLMYSGFPLVNVRGPVTGIIYRFSPAQPVQPVDARDRQLLLVSQLFRQCC